ncbi:MAG: hypothetical protein ABJE95_13640 [Byssovorax sp.]
MASVARAHKWRFFRAGGFDQVLLDRGEDLLALGELDQKLWVALACPTEGLEFDKKTLDLIDADKDGRIRAPELIAAVKWAGSLLRDPGELVKGSPSLALASINVETDEGKRVLASAKQILKDLGKKGAKEITLEDTADTAKIFGKTRFNGDGVLPASSADDEAITRVIEDILACLGGEIDRSGLDGVTQARVDRFFEEATAFSAWWATAESDATNVMPLGAATVEAAKTLAAIHAKIGDYFARCRLAAFDPRAAGPLNRDEAEYTALASRVLSAKADEVAAFPLARVAAGQPLPLDSGVNPAWADALKKLRDELIVPLLGERTALTETEWQTVSTRLAPFEAWSATRAGAAVEKLGLARVREILASDARAQITALVARDHALEPETAAIISVDRLVRYHRDLYTLATNFVSFSAFYSRKKAVFQAGTLYLDARSCDLCVKVGDADAHAALASHSGTYLAYCEITRKVTGEKRMIAAAFTDGGSDDLVVGKNGIFYDREGRDWDATIVRLVAHPISVREAFWLPYKRVGKLIGEQINKFASSRDKEMQDKAAANVDSGSKVVVVAQAAPLPEPPFDIARFVGIFAGIGIAIGAIGSVLLAIAGGFLSLRIWQMPLAIGGVILLISFPSMLIAYLKLRQRTIGPILNANGWAVNARVKMNVPFGKALTAVATLPAHAERSTDDPFADKTRPWGLAVIVLLVVAGGVAWKLGYAATWIEELKNTAPAAAPATSAAPAAPVK